SRSARRWHLPAAPGRSSAGAGFATRPNLRIVSPVLPQDRYDAERESEPETMNDGQTDLRILAETEIFHSLSGEALEEVRRLASRRRLEKREALYHQGDAAENFYVVIVGRLRATQTTAEG